MATPIAQSSAWRKLLDGEDGEDVDELLVDGLVDLDGPGDGDIDNLVVLHPYHHIPLALLEGLDGSDAKTAGKNPVHCCGSSAPLKVSEYRYPHIELRILLSHPFGVVHRAAVLL